MSALSITITQAGRAEVINATNNGTNAVNIAEVALGTGKYIPSDTQTSLTNETKRLTTIAGLAVNSDTLHVTIKDETTDSYNVSEIGLYTNTGVLFAIYSDSTDFLQKTSKSTLLISVDLILTSIDAAILQFGTTSFSNPPASQSTSGVAKIATETEVISGTNNTKIITALRLKERIDSILGGVSTSFNTLKKLADVISTKLGKTEKAADSEKLNGAIDSEIGKENTIVKRNSNGDVVGRVFKSEINILPSIPGYYGVAVTDSTKHHIPCTRQAFVEFAGIINSTNLWVDVTASRSPGIFYTNTLNRQIVVCISGYHNDTLDSYFYVNGVKVGFIIGHVGNGRRTVVNAIIPPGATYFLENNHASQFVITWSELK